MGGVKGSRSIVGKGKKHWKCPSEIGISTIWDIRLLWLYVCLYIPWWNGIIIKKKKVIRVTFF